MFDVNKYGYYTSIYSKNFINMLILFTMNNFFVSVTEKINI